MNPIIINNELSSSVLTIYDNGSSLAIDGANGTYFLVAIDTNAAYTFSNIIAGIKYTIRIKNTHVSDTITITNPNVAGWILESATVPVPIPAGYYRSVELFYNGSVYELTYGSLKTATV